MAITLENVGIAVRDLEAAIAFFTDLGLSVLGRDTVRGDWADTAVGLDGNHAKIALLQTPDRHDCHPLRGVADYQGIYRLTYLRGPSGILVMLAQDMTRS